VSARAEVRLDPGGRLSLILPGGIALLGVAAGAEVVVGEEDASAAALVGGAWRGAAARSAAGRAERVLCARWRRDPARAAEVLARAAAEGGAGDASGAAGAADGRLRLVGETGGEGAPSLVVALEVEERAGLVTLVCALENRGARAAAVRRIVPLALLEGPRLGAGLVVGPGGGSGGGGGGAGLGLEGGACALADPDPGARLLRLGWSIAVPPLPIGPRDRDDAAIAPPLGLRLAPRPLLEMGFDPAGMPERARGRAVSAHAAVLRPLPGGPALALGFSRERRQSGRVRVAFGGSGRGGGGRARALGARGGPGGALEGGGGRGGEGGRGYLLLCESDPDGRVLAPGEALSSEALHLAVAARPHDALALWAAEAGRRAGARPRPLRYWCTWYAAPCDRIDERFVASSVAALAARRAPLDAVIVDDGWQRAIGDWGLASERFPQGLRALARTIREAGFRPGIWLAPFAVAPGSRLLAAHPEWVVRDAAGRPRPAGWIAKLGLPRPYFALDATRSEVRAHLEATAAHLVRSGFDALKVDFLTAGALAGARADPRASRAEAYALGLEALRRGAGEAWLGGAIAPWAWNAGWVDAQRVGTDVAFGTPVWETPLARLGDWTSPSVRNALPGMLALGALDGRLFANDGDCVVARGLAPGLARALALANLALSSVTAVGDDPRGGDGGGGGNGEGGGGGALDALALLARIGAFRGPSPGGGAPLDLLERTLPERIATREGRVLRVRWGARGGAEEEAAATEAATDGGGAGAAGR
jgi:hypothetical protein